VRLGITSLLAAALVLVAAALAACGDGTETGSPTDTQQPTPVPSSEAAVGAVTSLEIFADMVRNVGGERVDVEALLPSGADPHTFELSPGKAADIANADIVFINGLDLEHSIEDIVDNAASGPVIELAAGLPVLEDGNPHLWLDPRMGAEYAEHIRDALIDIDPAGQAEYEANTTAYLEQLGELDAEYAAAIEAIPQERRKLVTFHDAYPYLAARYALEVVGVVVPSPGQEPSARDLADLIDAIEAQHVPAVFKEPQFNSEVLDQAASSAGVEVLDLLSDAYADGVDSYIGLMRFNLQQLEAGLGGD
jgi:ABC-type Zn uptake system ZnuABC Zn-binding protein ZnuA